MTGSLALPAWFLFAIVFYWTPPHFWALSLRYRDDYAAAGVPMLPVVVGVEATLDHIVRYQLLVAGVSLLPYTVGVVGLLYLVGGGGAREWRWWWPPSGCAGNRPRRCGSSAGRTSTCRDLPGDGGRRPRHRGMTAADTAPIRPEERFDERSLADHLRRHLPELVGDAEITFDQFPGGAANLTYRAVAASVELVIRRAPLGPVAAAGHDMAREYRVLSRLWSAYPLAPRAYHYCDDPASSASRSW